MNKVDRERNNRARVEKLLSLKDASGLPVSYIAKAAGLKHSTYIGYLHLDSPVSTKSLRKLADFHGVYFYELLDPQEELLMSHDASKLGLFSIENAVRNTRVLTLMRNKSYHQVALELGVNSRMIERVGLGIEIQRADIYCELARYFGLAVAEFCQDIVQTPEVVSFFQQSGIRTRMQFIARLNGGRVSRIQTSKTGRVSKVGAKDVHLNDGFVEHFAFKHNIPARLLTGSLKNTDVVSLLTRASNA